jgi:CxxC-x17-CxxC domain-containing protein
MGNFDRGGNRGGFGGGARGGFSKPRGFERGGDMPTYKATCAECGKSCDVPFRPTSGKPVYCNDCFGAKRETEDRAPRKEFGNRAFGKPEFNRNDRPSFDRGGRDEFKGRSEFPARAAVAPAMNTDKLEKQMSDISFKLEKLTDAIMKMSAPKVEVAAPKAVVPVVEKKVEAKVAKAVVKASVKAVAKAAPKAVAKKAAPASKKVAAKKKK